MKKQLSAHLNPHPEAGNRGTAAGVEVYSPVEASGGALGSHEVPDNCLPRKPGGGIR
jgi:hypothetical protein